VTKKTLLPSLFVSLSALAAACSSGGENSGAATSTASPPPAAERAAASPTPTPDEIPASVRAAFPNAQSYTKQHKDLSDEQVAAVEKSSGLKVGDKDHHSFLAFTTEGGARKQVGAATVVQAVGREVTVIYGSAKGQPVINEVRADGVSVPFLAQFKGKGHDDKLKLGTDIKAQGADEAVARAVTDAIRLDVAKMQALYGSSHSH
jgi:hypothetical protein